MLVWQFVSFVLTITAVITFQALKDTFQEADKAAEIEVASFEETLKQAHPVVVGRLSGTIPFGSVAVTLPPWTRSQLETIFQFPSDPDTTFCESLAQRKLIPYQGLLGNCTTQAETFFGTYGQVGEYSGLFSGGRVNRTDSSLIQMYARVEVTQTSWFDLLFISLLLDMVMVIFQTITMLVARMQLKQSHFVKKLIFATEIAFVVGASTLCCLVTVLIFIEPVVFSEQVTLVRVADFFREVVITPVKIAPSARSTTDGAFAIEFTDDIGTTVTRCFEDLSEEPTLFQANLLFYKFVEYFESGRLGKPDLQTCDFLNPRWDVSTKCLTFDCSGGIIPIVSGDALKTRKEFVYLQIIFSVLAIDLIVILIDVCIIFLRLQRKKHTTATYS